MDNVNQSDIFKAADLLEYSMDKPIGAARAALQICLEGTGLSADLVISELAENMELNQKILGQVVNALHGSPDKVLESMPKRVWGKQLERDLGL
jgi:hypothetical protein